jgi:signal transduction histidine kinase
MGDLDDIRTLQSDPGRPVSRWTALVDACRAVEQADYAAAAARLDRVLSGDLPRELRAYAWLQLGVARLHLGDARGSLAACREGLALEPLDDGLLRAELRGQAAVASKHLGLRPLAVQMGTEALEVARGLEGAEAQTLIATVHNNLAVVWLSQGEYRAAADELRAALDHAAALPPVVHVMLRVNLGRARMELGELQAARRVLEEAVEGGERCGGLAVLHAREGLARVRWREGDPSAALELVKGAVEAWRERQALPGVVMALTLRGALRHELGRSGAVDDLLEAVALADRIGNDELALAPTKHLASVREAEGDHRSAVIWHRRRHALERARYDAVRSQQVEELRALHDVGRKEQEARVLREQSAALERLVAQRTRDLAARNVALQEARDQARAALEAKSAFLAVTSHELRTPLNAIAGYTELLLEDLDDGLALEGPEVAGDLRAIQGAGARLRRLVDGILRYTQLEAGPPPLEPDDIDPRALLEGVRAEQQALADHRGLTLSVTVDPAVPATLHTDGAALSEVVHHLVHNGLAFTEEGGVHLVATMVGDEVQVAVHDTGVGIPEQAVSDLFVPFHQVDMSYTRPHDGLGLGLALSRQLMRALGGDVSVQSSLGEGSVFTLRLPAR